jgi:dihydrofolate reductase
LSAPRVDQFVGLSKRESTRLVGATTRDRSDAKLNTPRADRAAGHLSTIDAAQGKNVLVIGADIARQCMEERRIDEIMIHLAPVLLGEGVRLFSCPGLANGIRLETIGAAQSGQLTNLQFPVVK